MRLPQDAVQQHLALAVTHLDPGFGAGAQHDAGAFRQRRQPGAEEQVQVLQARERPELRRQRCQPGADDKSSR